MDGRGGCCIARYCGGRGGGGVYGSYDMSKVDLIMHRFRPIAPKPVAGGEVSGAGEEAERTMKKKKSEAQARVGGRGKRRHCNGSPNPNPSKRCNKRRKSSSSSSKSPDRDENQTVVTLPLLPQSPEPKVFSKERIKTLSPTWLSFDEEKKNNNNNIIDVNAVPSYNPDRRVLDDRTVRVGPWRGVRVVGSSVTVECVTDTWTDRDGLGRTDEERRANLERDTCPGFVSDGFGRVTWTNGAYRSMVVGQGGGDLITVWLVMKERLPAGVTLTYPAFTCRVRLQCHVDGQDVMKKTLPCDVWRLDGGGFAWRLDVKAALCLGR